MIFLGTDVELASQDGLDPRGARGIKKMYCTVDIAVVGDGHSFLSDFVDVGDQLFYITSAVKKRIVRVQVKVGEFCHEVTSSLVCWAGQTEPADVQKGCRLRKSGDELNFMNSGLRKGAKSRLLKPRYPLRVFRLPPHRRAEFSGDEQQVQCRLVGSRYKIGSACKRNVAVLGEQEVVV
jgi:hypothetical protein